MRTPKMILFDYGQTLIDEQCFDGVKGTAALMRYAVKNKYGKTPEEIQAQADEIYRELGRFDPARRHLFQIEVSVYPFNAYLYEANGIELSVSGEEAERIFWNEAAPGKATPGMAAFLGFLKEQGIRTGVISNISFSGKALKERIDRLLPDHEFEFIIASSDYVFRKPNRRIFDLALEKAGLRPEEVWYVGDQYECDVAGARAAGMFPVWYTGAVDFEQEAGSDVLQIGEWRRLQEYLTAVSSGRGQEDLFGIYPEENNRFRIPAKIRELIGDREYRIDDVGMSDSRVICFDDMVLKIEKAGDEPDREHEMLKWLKGKLPVPEILHFEKKDGYNYLLMSRAEGVMSCEEEYLDDPELLVRLLAEGLRLLWSVDTKSCPGQSGLDEKLRFAEGLVEQGLCDTEHVEADTYGENGFRDPADLLDWLNKNRPEEDPVFSHGDYCLPNLFLKDGKVSGFIDLGRSGIADRYQDIALCYRSLMHNYSGQYGGKVYWESHPDFRPESLFDMLGMEPDWAKIRYYILLDELF